MPSLDMIVTQMIFRYQENRLQIFKLPEPVLCVGGFLQIELLGRVQRQDVDGLFYIWLVLKLDSFILLCF